MNPAILDALAGELHYHREVPEDEELNNALNGAYTELAKIDWQREEVDLPMRERIEQLVKMLQERFQREHFDRLTDHFPNLHWALVAINYRLQIMRMQVQKTADVPSEVSARFREIFG